MKKEIIVSWCFSAIVLCPHFRKISILKDSPFLVTEFHWLLAVDKKNMLKK